MASSTGARHRRARKLATLVTVVACFVPFTAQSQAAVLDQGGNVALPTIKAGDVEMLGPSTVRVRGVVDTGNLDSTVYLRYGEGSVLNQRTANVTLGGEPAADRGRSRTCSTSSRAAATTSSSSPRRRPAPFASATPSRSPCRQPCTSTRRPAESCRAPPPRRQEGTRCTIVGTAKRDKLVGTKKRDVICGLGGNDRIAGRGRQRPDPRRQGQRPRLRWIRQRRHPRQQRP